MTQDTAKPSDITLAYAGKLFPSDQLSTFASTDQIFPTRTISKGSVPTAAIPRAVQSIDDLPVVAGNESYDLFDYISRNRLTGLTIVKDGETLFERYETGLGPETRWMSMSMAKSVSTTLVGCAIRDGYISGVDDQLIDYLPILADGGYDGVSIRHLLQMTSGVRWDDTHTDAESDIWNASSAGDLLYHTALDSSKTIDSGDIFKITSGNLTVTLA